MGDKYVVLNLSRGLDRARGGDREVGERILSYVEDKKKERIYF